MVATKKKPTAPAKKKPAPAPKSVKTSRKDLVNLFEALGFEGSDKWSEALFQKKISKLPDSTEDQEELEDDELNDLLQELLDAVEEEKTVTISGFDKEEEEEEDNPEDEGDDETEEEEEEEDEESASSKKKKKASTKPSKNGNGRTKVGVVSAILEQLQAASFKKPILEAKILAALVKKFPDREEKAMKHTLYVQLHSEKWSSLMKRGIQIGHKEEGFWVKSTPK